MKTTAIVLAGAGARGAYEAGVLSVLVPRLLEQGDDRIILVGTSAGAINTAILAGFDTAAQAVTEMTSLWSTIDVGDVFSPVLTTTGRTIVRYLREVFHRPHHLTGLLDSHPLGATMRDRLDWKQLDQNLQGDGWVHTAGIVATSCERGRCVVFAQGSDLTLPEPDEKEGIDYVATMLQSEHVMASAAIPVAFQPVHIEKPSQHRGWYIDGGVKLNAPIKPAISLGADRIVMVATTPDPSGPHANAVSNGEPDIFDASSVVMQSMLVDRMADDVRALRRVNTLLARHEHPPSGYRSIPNLYIGPPEPGTIARTANRVFSQGYGGIRAMLSDLGVLGRVIGGTRESHGDLLSFVFFDREFHAALIELGRSHTERALGPKGSPIPWDEPEGPASPPATRTTR